MKVIVTPEDPRQHCRVQETPRPEIVVIEDLDGRSVLDNAHALGD